MNGKPRVKIDPIEWLTDPVRAALEQAVSRHLGRAWRIVGEKDFSEFACHPVAIVSDGSFSVFFKLSEDAEARRQFEAELSDLTTLSSRAAAESGL